MLDHRTGGDACPYANPTTGEFIWTRASNRFGWRALQGDYRADDERRGWFSPSLADDLTGLPPAYIARSEEHTSGTPVTNAHLVCRLLLEKKTNETTQHTTHLQIYQ